MCPALENGLAGRWPSLFISSAHNFHVSLDMRVRPAPGLCPEIVLRASYPIGRITWMMAVDIASFWRRVT
jgi:hypothetical protein